MFADGKLGASFFCSRDYADRSNLQAIFPTLAVQLAYQYQLFRERLLQVLKGPDATKESLCSQMEKLIVGPLRAAGIPTLIIIDALDECKDEEPASAILSILSRYVNEIPSVKFFITGRPEPHIHSGFRLRSLLPITEVLKLHEVKPEKVNKDIKLYFQTQLTEYANNRIDCDLQHWPSPSEIDILCEKAAGYFIYASTVIKFIKSKSYPPTRRLNQITSLPQNTSHEGKSGIDILYTQVLKQAVDDVEADDEEFYSYFRTVVGAVVLVFNPLSVEALSDLLGESGVSTTLHSLHSLLLVPMSKDDPVRIFHKSFPDFLVDQKRCTDSRFFIDPPFHHTEILLSCLKLMMERLKRNICGLDDYVTLCEVEDLSGCQKEYIGDALEYACCFWTKHLLWIPGSGPDTEKVQEAVGGFFTTCLLFWIEVLSLVGKLGIGVHAINDIQQWYGLVSCLKCLIRIYMLILVQAGLSCKWANDSQRLLLEWFDVVHDSPFQVYHLALPFCPSPLWLHECYATELSREVKVVKGLPAEWGTCSRTVAFDHPPITLTCWKDVIAVGLDSGDIVTLDGITGIQTAILSEHTLPVISLAFFPNGTSLVSGSRDSSIKLWDMQTGGVVKTFHGHTAWVFSVAISADSTMIASGSYDTTICLWNIQTEECHHIIQQQEGVVCVEFSPTVPQHLVSVSNSGIRCWDINGHQTNPTHNGSCIAYSLDGTKFVSCQGENIMVHNFDSGAIIAKFLVTNSRIYYCCFSPDGKLIAVAGGYTIYIWNTDSSHTQPIKTLVGHTLDVDCFAFSSPSSLISLSMDGSVKFWQIGTLEKDQVVTDLESIPFTSAQVMSITLQPEDGIAISSDREGVVRTWDISTGLCKASFQTPAEDPEYSDARLINNTLIFVWYMKKDQKIQIWDVEKGELQMVVAPKGYVADVRISGDGSSVFCLYFGLVQAWSIQTGDIMGEVRFRSSTLERTLTVHGSRVWIHAPGPRFQGWDFRIPGSSPVELSNTPMLYPNHTKMWDFESRIKDAISGKLVLQLAGRFAQPVNSQWDGQHLVAGYRSGEVLILNFNQMLL